MIGTLLGLIFVCVILGLAWWAAQALLATIPIAEPFATIIRVLVILVGAVIVIWILIQILAMAGIPVNTFGFGRIR